MAVEEAHTIGWALWRVRDDRGQSLRVIAGLAGMSKDTLNRIETGRRSPTVSELEALAKALEISVPELTRLPVPAPGNGHTDSAIVAVDRAVMAVSHGLGHGQVLPVEVLRARITAMVDALCGCEREREVGAALPGLIQDLHASIAAGRDVAELLELSAWLHTQATVPWLSVSAGAVDLRGQAVMLARHAAQEHGGAVPLGLVAAAGARVALAKGAFGIAQGGLDAVAVPTTTSQTMQLAGFLALRRSVVAAADQRRGDVDAPLEYAAELAARTGEGNAYGLGFGPTLVGQFRMEAALNVGDHEHAATIAEGLNPELYPNHSGRANHWADYGQALARLRGRHNDAVTALRRVELISPHRIQRNPIIRDVLAVLLQHSRQGSSADQELRGMARRAGLPV